MKENPISDEQLNAFLDNQLSEDECAQIMAVMQTDKLAASKLCELRQLKEMVNLAYSEFTLPKFKPAKPEGRKHYKLAYAAALSITLSFGFAFGWYLNNYAQKSDPYAFYLSSEVDAKTITGAGSQSL